MLDGAAEPADLGAVDHRPQTRERMALPLLLEDQDLFVEGRVPERRAQQEAVELRFGQGKRSLLLDRVLGRDEKKRVGQSAADTVDGDLKLGHALEHCRLRLR